MPVPVECLRAVLEVMARVKVIVKAKVILIAVLEVRSGVARGILR